MASLTRSASDGSLLGRVHEEPEPELPDDAAAPLLAPSFGAAPPAKDGTVSWEKMRPLLKIGLPLLAFMIGQLCVFVPLQQLVIQWICDDVLPPETGTDDADADRCNAPIVQSTAAQWTAVLTVSSAVPALFVVPWLAHLSDTRWGRKRLMMLPILGVIISDAALVLLTWHARELGVTALYIMAALGVLTAFFGGGGGIMVAVMGYVADITEARDRTVMMGRLQAVFMSALLIGPASGGLMVKLTGSNLTPFFFAIAVDLLVLAHIALFVTDPPRRAKDGKDGADPHAADGAGPRAASSATLVHPEDGIVGAPVPSMVPVKPARPARRRSTLEAVGDAVGRRNLPRTVLIAAVFLATCGSVGGRAILVLYTRLEFGWKAFESGIFLSAFAVGQIAALLLVLPAVVRVAKRALGPAHEVWMIRASFLGDVALYCCFAAARRGWQFMLPGAVLAPLCHALGSPAVRSLLSTLTAPEAQARMFSALHVVEGVATIVSQLAFPTLYAHLVAARRERAVMLAVAGVMAAALAVSALLSSTEVAERKREQEAAGEETVAGGEAEGGRGGAEAGV